MSEQDVRSPGNPMVARQRQRALYRLGCTAAAARNQQRASKHFEEALQLALELDELDATAESAFALAGAHRALHRFGAAVSALEIALMALTAAGGTEPDPPPALLGRMADAKLALATCEYVRGHFDAAQHWLEQADALIPRLAKRHAAGGSVAATRALLARARGEPEVALRQALVALDLAEVGHDATLRWARALVVECTLDLAELLPAGPAGATGGTLLALARGYVDDPPRLPTPGRQRSDAPPLSLADGVAYLASIRYLRLAGAAGTADRLAAYERLIAAAEQPGNEALRGLAFSALGDDLAARGAHTPALRAYEVALQEIDGGDMAAIGLRARRALLRYREDHLDE